MKHMAWTYNYEPFTVGGNVWKPMKAEVECEKKVEIDYGISLFIFKHNDKYYAIEDESCGIVGCSNSNSYKVISDVIEDMQSCSQEEIKKSIKDAKQKFINANEVSTEAFLRRLGNAKE